MDNNKVKILLADDDVTTRMLLRASITQWNYSVIEANDGEEALSLAINSNPPMLLLVDWMMPKLSGIELCQKISQNLTVRPYTIVLTHNKGTVNLVKAIEAGADEFIEKPVNLEELRCRLIVASRIINSTYHTIK